MTFALTPAAPFTASVSTITAATANAWRSYFPQALDAVNGGVYTNLTEIEFGAGSAGVKFSAPLTMSATSTVLFAGGGSVTINSDPTLTGTMRVGLGGAGGSVRFYATSTLTVDDTVAMSFAGDATWTGASTQTHANLSTDTYSAGSVLAINTASATLGTAATLTVNGASGGGNTATVAFGQYSTITIANGSAVTATIGGGGTAGSLTVAASGTLTVSANGTLTVADGAAVTMSVGGGGTPGTLTINADGTLTTTASADFVNGGTTTRTGKEVLSGNGAYTAKRIVAAADPPTDTDPRRYDILEVSFLAADEDLDLINLGASDYVEFWVRFSATSKDLTVKSGGLPIYVFVHSAGTQRTVQFYWDGSGYKVGCVGAQTTI